MLQILSHLHLSLLIFPDAVLLELRRAAGRAPSTRPQVGEGGERAEAGELGTARSLGMAGRTMDLEGSTEEGGIYKYLGSEVLRF